MRAVVVWMIVGGCASTAIAQSSSLYVHQNTPAPVVDGQAQNPFMQQASYLAVAVPEPREFNVHDLVTIIVREAASSTAESVLETEKSVNVNGEVSAFPIFDPAKLIGEGRNQPGNPNVDVTFSREFEGEGDYERNDETVFRITARVIDVKPNGTLALEARKQIANDEEQMTITLTGYCRAEDVGGDNTVLSTQMFDLRIDKQHKGEVRKANEKGIFTKAIDFLLNF